MTSSFPIVKADGSSFDIYALEGDGSTNVSMPRQVLSAIISGGAGVNYFELADDLKYRFIPGFEFQIIMVDPLSFPPSVNEGIYQVALTGSVFTGQVTQVPVVEVIPRGYFTVVDVAAGAPGTAAWYIAGTHAAEFSPGIVGGILIVNGVTINSNTIVGVTAGTGGTWTI